MKKDRQLTTGVSEARRVSLVIPVLSCLYPSGFRDHDYRVPVQWAVGLYVQSTRLFANLH